jgi:hypothetical protein
LLFAAGPLHDAADTAHLARRGLGAANCTARLDPHALVGLDVLHVLRLPGRRLGDVDRPSTDQRAACREGRQFRKGHTNRHKRCSLLFPRVCTGLVVAWGNRLVQGILCHQKRRELLKPQPG